MTEVGEQAPPFVLKDHLGTDVALADFRGRQKVVLVFYIFSWTGI